MYAPKLIFTLIVILFITSCASTPPNPKNLRWPVSDEPIGENEIVLVDSQVTSFSSGENQGILQIRVRFSEDSYAYQLAFAPRKRDYQPSEDEFFEATVRYVDAWYDLYLRPVSFANGKSVIDHRGTEYWVSPWHWHVEHYITASGREAEYGRNLVAVRKKVRNSLINFPRWRQSAGAIKPIDLRFSPAVKYADFQNQVDNTLTGESALLASENPEAVYDRYFAAKRKELVDEINRKAAARGANQAYQRFVYSAFGRLTLAEAVKRADCPVLPSMAQSYDPPAEWYRLGDSAIARANCLSAVLNRYQPDPLISAYEQNLDREAELYGATYKIKRFSLEEALKHSRQIFDEIQFASRRAQALYDGGDYWAVKNQQRRANQARKAQAMQSLVRGMQALDQTLQQQNRQTEANVRRLQAQAFERHANSSSTQPTASKSLPEPKPVPAKETSPGGSGAELSRESDSGNTPAASPTSTPTTDTSAENSCWIPASTCLTASADWSEQTDGRVIVTYRNTCERRILVKKCNERTDGSADCGSGGINPGGVSRWATSNATGRYSYRMVGVDEANKDFICLGEVDNWAQTPPWTH